MGDILNMNKEELLAFELKINNHKITQREVAHCLGISLGKCNQLFENLKLNKLLNENLLISNYGNNFIKEHRPRRAVILAAGYGMRMVPINTEQPKGLIEINGEPLIERIIKQLQKKGIDDISIVAGFMKEYYEYLIDKYQVKIIVNTHYGDYNNIYSLYLMKNRLNNCYVIPCDIWFKKNPFSKVEDGSWYMFSDDVQEHSKWKVTNRNSVKKVANNGNRMVGLAYLDDDYSQILIKKLEIYINHAKSLKEFWELILDNDGKFMIAPYKVSHQSYFEINSYEDLRAIDSNSEHLKNDAIGIICRSLSVTSGKIHNIRVLKKGMTNRSFLFECLGDQYIMRIPGMGTDKLINRYDEYNVYKKIKALPYVEKTLYMNPKNGYKLTRFINNSRNCIPTNWSDVSKCMGLLRKFHNSKIKVAHTFNLEKQIRMYEQLRNRPSSYRDYNEVKERINKLLVYVNGINKDWTLCHIDANADNFIFDNKGHVFLIDWEYAGMQDPDIDIAMFAIYSMFSQDQINRLINCYFQKNVSRQTVTKIYAYIAICGFLWSNWCEYKQSLGLDFGEYSLAQYRYAKEYSKKVLRQIRGNDD